MANYQTMKHVIKEIIRANMVESPLPKIVPVLWGKQGIGKSDMSKEIASELDLPFVYLHLATQETGDLIGRPYDSVEGDKTVMRWSTPSWIDYIQKHPEGGVLALEELNRAQISVLQAMIEFLLTKTLHTHKIPDTWHLMVLCNPSLDGYAVNELDDALLGRCCHLVLTPTVSDWVGYAKENHPKEVISWIQAQGDMLGVSDSSFELPFKIESKPRRVSMFSRMVASCDDMQTLTIVGKGLIGLEATSAYLAYIQSAEKPLSAEIILNDYDKARQWFIDNQAATNDKDIRLDLVNAALKEFIDHISSKDFKKTDKVIDIIWDLGLNTLLPEVAMSFFASFPKNDKGESPLHTALSKGSDYDENVEKFVKRTQGTVKKNEAKTA